MFETKKEKYLIDLAKKKGFVTMLDVRSVYRGKYSREKMKFLVEVAKVFKIDELGKFVLV